jgi:hypothetical protein
LIFLARPGTTSSLAGLFIGKLKKATKMLAYDTLSDTSRVWIYQANRPFEDKDIPALKTKIDDFARSWVSHNRQLRAVGDVLHRRFIVLLVDESQADASGCSIDKSVYFLKQLQGEYGVDLFDRMVFSYLEGEEVVTVPRDIFAQRYQDGQINDETPVFDTLVNNLRDFQQSWVKPLGQSWHRRMC